MSALVDTRPADMATSVVAPLALQEGRRLLRHPVMLLGFALLTVATLTGMQVDDGPRQAFNTADSAVIFFPGVFAILAAHLVATRDQRAGTTEALAPVPTPRATRLLALQLGCLAPALASAVAVGILHAAHLFLDRYQVVPGAYHLAQGPVAVYGGCVLGVLIATWFPSRGAIAVGLVVTIAVNVYLAGDAWSDRQLFAMAHSWAAWQGDGRTWGGLVPGDPGWHLLYLLGLVAMAVTGALLRVSEDRRRAVLLASVAVALAVVGGIGQLP